MLVLARKCGQSIDIYTRDGVITILLAKQGPTRSTIAVEAPRHCRILRGEMELPEHERAELLAQVVAPPQAAGAA